MTVFLSKAVQNKQYTMPKRLVSTILPFLFLVLSIITIRVKPESSIVGVGEEIRFECVLEPRELFGEQ